MTEWLRNYPMAIVGLVLWAVGVIWLMPGRKSGAPRASTLGLLITAAGLITFCFSCGKPQAELADEVMFWLFGVGALLCGVLMITSRNPVYAALWFALATLSTCGLFLLQSAPFLAAATIIVYAGAVIVTFLFVIMLAQQSGEAGYDQRSRQSVAAIVSGFVFLGAIAFTLQSEGPRLQLPEVVVAAVVEQEDPLADAGPMPGAASPFGPVAVQLDSPNILSKADSSHPVGDMKGLGRSLFGDYLFAVEIAGTLLLIASIGAIAIAPRREQGAL